MDDRIEFKALGSSFGDTGGVNRDVSISKADIVAVRSVSDEHTMIYLTSGISITVVKAYADTLAALDG